MEKVEGRVLDLISERLFKGRVVVDEAKIVDIQADESISKEHVILPGLVDSHIHIESSMLTPSNFSQLAIRHGTIAIVSDPHEIANVLGIEGVRFMISDAKNADIKIFFGAPSCVPATVFDSGGAVLSGEDIKLLFKNSEVKFLSEMMNFPGVLNQQPEVVGKLALAKKYGLPVDGHAPGLRGTDLKTYIDAGISTDHEAISLEEAIEKIRLGMKIQIREGSAAKSFDLFSDLFENYADDLMLCSDDIHPDDLLKGHINLLLKRGIAKGIDLFKLLKAAILNPVLHYKLEVGLLRIGDPADFILVDNLKNFNVIKTYINGRAVFNSKSKIKLHKPDSYPNAYFQNAVKPEEIRIPDKNKDVKIIEVEDGQLYTKAVVGRPAGANGYLCSDSSKDILKMVVLNRYQEARPALGFVKNFGIVKGGIISTIAHDCHNIICVGTDDQILLELIDWVNTKKGGIAYSDGEKITGLPLPIAGIISDKSAPELAHSYMKLNELVKEAGCGLSAPFMTLSFLSLLVIPELKLGDKTLFDVNSFAYTDLYVDKPQ